MSYYHFIASGSKLEEYCIGIEIKNRNCIIIPDETKTLNIFADDDCRFSANYTTLPNILCVEFSEFETIANDFLEYIKKQMEFIKAVELWNTWLDEIEEPERIAVNIEDFRFDDLMWIYGEQYYTHPKCLKIYKWTK